jgi:hypothetical protein
MLSMSASAARAVAGDNIAGRPVNFTGRPEKKSLSEGGKSPFAGEIRRPGGGKSP